MLTATYAALLTLLYIRLCFIVIGHRKRLLVAIGDGGDKQLARAIRVQGNFAEYVPIALILLFLAEYNQLPTWLLHGAGGCLLIGRLLHAVGVAQVKENYNLRRSGMILTFISLLGLSISFVINSLMSLI
ncbi:glutathione metabolism protein [Saccharobesus litoralis]|uniref:Glutathione metabolism protein n=1 Tax=Saccharobesus litoralis TaxID=2172099 RepID=A0A2S0VUH5_9ALTE|nr:MAPEG family protein [Saccharobesus litoralis]AWB67750.1 glutathione metabolism protein [Saccharobesus litoralis]